MSDNDILKASKFIVTGISGGDERAITFELPLKKGDKGVQVLVIRDFLGVGMFDSDVFDDATKDSLRKWQLENKDEISEIAGLVVDPANPNSAETGWFSEFGVIRPATFAVMMRKAGTDRDRKKIQESAQKVLEYLDTKSELIKGADIDSRGAWDTIQPEDFDQPPTRDNEFVYVTWASGVGRSEVGSEGYNEFVESMSEIALRSATVKAFSFYNKSPIWKPDPQKGTWNSIMDFQNFPKSLRDRELQLTIIPIPTSALAENVPTVDLLYGQDLRERATPVFAAIKKIHSPSERPGSTFKFSVKIKRSLFDPIPEKGTLQELPAPDDIEAVKQAKAETNQLATEAAANWLESSKEELEKITSEVVEKCIAQITRDSQSDGLDKDGIRSALRDQLLAKAEQHVRDINTESFPACREYQLESLLAGKMRDEHGSFVGEGLIQTVVTRMENYDIQMKPWELIGGEFRPRLKVSRQAKELRKVIGATKELLRVNEYSPLSGDKIRFCFDEVKNWERLRPLGKLIPGIPRSLQPWAVKPPLQFVTVGLKIISAHIVKKSKEEIELTLGSWKGPVPLRPWNNPKTMGYLFNIEEMYKIARNSSFCSPTPPMSGIDFFKKFTHRVPALQTVFLFNEYKSAFDKFAGPIKTAAQKVAEDLEAAGSGAWKASIITDQGINVAAITDKLPAEAACTLEGLFAEFLDIFDFSSLFCNFAGCIPDLPWPLEFNWDFDFTLPMLPKLPTYDPLGWLLEMLLLMIISIIMGILCGLVRAILDILRDLLSIPGFPGCKDLLDVGDKDICELLGPNANTRAECIDKGVDCLEKMGIPVEHYTDIADLFDEVSLVLTPAELCALLGGNPTPTTLGIIKEIVIKTKPTLKDYLSSESEIEQFFSCMGDLIDPEVCKKISRLSNVVISDEVCPEKEIPSLRQRLKDLGASPEEIQNALAEAAKRRDEIKDLFKKDPLQDALPQVGCPAQGGLPGPYDNSNTEKLNNVAVKTALNSLEMAYRTDLAAYVPSFFDTVTELPGEDDMDFLDFHIHMNLMQQMQALLAKGEDPKFRDPRRSSTESDWVASAGEVGNIYKPYIYMPENSETMVVLATPEEHAKHNFPILIFHPGKDDKTRAECIKDIIGGVTAYRSTIEDGKLFQERLQARFLPDNQLRKVRISSELESLLKSNYSFGYSHQSKSPLLQGRHLIPSDLPRETLSNFISEQAPKRGEESHGLVVVGTSTGRTLEEVGDITADDVAYQEFPIMGYEHSVKDCFNVISHTVDKTIRAEDRLENINYRIKTTNLEIPQHFIQKRFSARDMESLERDTQRSLRAPAFANMFLNSWTREIQAHLDQRDFVAAADRHVREALSVGPRSRLASWETHNTKIANETTFLAGSLSQIDSGQSGGYSNGVQDSLGGPRRPFGDNNNRYNTFYYAQATAFLDAIGESISESRFFDVAQIEELNTRLVASIIQCYEEPCQGPMGTDEEGVPNDSIVPATEEKPCIKENDVALDFEQLRKDILKAYNESLCEPENDPVTRDFTKPGPLENAIADQMIYIYILSFALEFIMKGLFVFSRFDGEAIMRTKIVSSYLKDYLETKIMEELFTEEDPADSQRLVDRIKKITNEEDFDKSLDFLIEKVMKNAKNTLNSISNKAFEPEWGSYKEQFLSEMASNITDVTSFSSINNTDRRCYIDISDKFLDNKISTVEGVQVESSGEIDFMRLTHGCFYLEQYYRFSKPFLAALFYYQEWIDAWHQESGTFGERTRPPLNTYLGVFNTMELNTLISFLKRHDSPPLPLVARLSDADPIGLDIRPGWRLSDYLLDGPDVLSAGVRLMYIPPANHQIRTSTKAGRNVHFDEGENGEWIPRWSRNPEFKPAEMLARSYPFDYIMGLNDEHPSSLGAAMPIGTMFNYAEPASIPGDNAYSGLHPLNHLPAYTPCDDFILSTRAFLGNPRAGTRWITYTDKSAEEIEAITETVATMNANIQAAQARAQMEALGGGGEGEAAEEVTALIDSLAEMRRSGTLTLYNTIDETIPEGVNNRHHRKDIHVFGSLHRVESKKPGLGGQRPAGFGPNDLPYNFTPMDGPNRAAGRVWGAQQFNDADQTLPSKGREAMTPTPILNFEEQIGCVRKYIPDPGEHTGTGFSSDVERLSEKYKDFILKEYFGIQKEENTGKWRITSELSEDLKYLFEFIFPLDRYASLFMINQITILDRNEDLAELFDGTRAMANAIMRAMLTPPGLNDDHLSLDGGSTYSAMLASQGSEGPLEELKKKLKDIWPMIKKAMKMAPIIAARNSANFLDPAYKDMNKLYKKDPCKLRAGLTTRSLSNKGVVVGPFPFLGTRNLTKEGLTPCRPGGALPLYVPINRVGSDIGKSIVPLIFAAIPPPFGPWIPWPIAAGPIKTTVQHLINTALGTEVLESLGAGEDTGKYGKFLWVPGYLGLSVPELPGEEHKKKQKEFGCVSCDQPGRPMQPPPLCVEDTAVEEE